MLSMDTIKNLGVAACSSVQIVERFHQLPKIYTRKRLDTSSQGRQEVLLYISGCDENILQFRKNISTLALPYPQHGLTWVQNAKHFSIF